MLKTKFNIKIQITSEEMTLLYNCLNLYSLSATSVGYTDTSSEVSILADKITNNLLTSKNLENEMQIYSINVDITYDEVIMFFNCLSLFKCSCILVKNFERAKDIDILNYKVIKNIELI